MTAEATNARPVAVVTGAGRNLGRAMALTLLGAGVRVVLTGTSPAGIQETLRRSSAADGDALLLIADLADPGSRDTIAARALGAFGRVDILVNNAAIVPEHIWPDWDVTGEPQAWTLDDDLYRRFFEINAVAPQALARACIPGMIERGWGRIVNVTTSLDSMLELWPYGASKAALEAATAVLARQLDGTGVTANALLPGGFAKAESKVSASGEVLHEALPPDIMRGPIRWLASPASDGFNGRRVVAVSWDAEQPDQQAAAAAASYPVAWTGYGPGVVNAPRTYAQPGGGAMGTPVRRA